MILPPNTTEALYGATEWEELLPQLCPDTLMEIGPILLTDMSHFNSSEKYFLMHLYNHSLQQRLLDTAFPAQRPAT